mmetsp:Transcript_22685/g.27824  ORF Transcript_22685/g.27824 Transcript_22685/m.27824 type:complete len:365 (-) Transcript_22685:29-1123(-)
MTTQTRKSIRNMSHPPSTPPSLKKSSQLVTPTPNLNSPSDEEKSKSSKSSLKMPPLREKSASKKLLFGRVSPSETITINTVQSNTRDVYTLVNKMTGSIGGNGHGGAIYGELTVGSMQKMVDLMKFHTNFGPKSRFIDVGSGLGKPNLHVTQDPGVEFSYGIEMEHVRWVLGMSNLNKVLEHAKKQPRGEIGHRCIFEHGDVTDAKYFDPFTHVYMFDIGFPPRLFKQLGQMYNRSDSEYLICYHGPRLIIDRYGFNVELIVQTSTSMHGSSECHMGYIYRRDRSKSRSSNNVKIGKDRVLLEDGIPSDPLFANAWKLTRRDVEPLLNDVKEQVTKNLSSCRPTRKRKAVSKDIYIPVAKVLSK